MDLQVIRQETSPHIPQELKDIYMRTVFSGLTEEEATVAYRLARRLNLDVEARQMFFVVHKDKHGQRKVVNHISVDGLRVIAFKTGKYGGSVNPRLTIKDRQGKRLVVPHEEYDPGEADKMISATISVINTDFPQPQTATALYSSYAKTYDGKPTGTWLTMPDVMLLKCAESMALRKAFPNDLSGLYSVEEMDAVRNDGIIVNAVSPKPSLKDYKPQTAMMKADRVLPASHEANDSIMASSAKNIPQTSPEDVKTEGKEAADSEKPVSSKKQTIRELIESIPEGLQKMKTDIDPDIFDYCKVMCMDFLGIDRIADASEDRLEDLRSFMRTAMIERLKEHGYL